MHDISKTRQHLHILTLRLDVIRERHLLEQLIKAPETGERLLVVTANPEIALYAMRHPNFELNSHREADYIVADGIGLVLASWFFGKPVPERVIGVDLTEKLLAQAQERNWRVAFALPPDGLLKPEVWQTVVAKKWPHLKSTILSVSDKELAQQNFSEFDLLFSTHGFPYQEQALFILKRQNRGAHIMLGVGASLDFLSGIINRAPRPMRSLGLEWLFRFGEALCNGNKRSRRANSTPRWRRILNATIIFPLTCVAWILRSMILYRPAVVLCLFNQNHDILIAEWHEHKQAWHIPQGGINPGEDYETAARRELREELSVTQVSLVKIVPNVYRYTWSPRNECRLWWGFRGQRQTLCYFKLLKNPETIKPDNDELRTIRWVSPTKLVDSVTGYKKPTAKLALKYLPYELK